MVKINFSLEEQFLRYCAQSHINDRISLRLNDILGRNLNWPYILQKSMKEGIACLAYHNLLQHKQKIPDNIWENFKGIYYRNMTRNHGIYQEMNAVLSCFHKEALNVIPLKGIFLAEKVYENIALRAMTDIDLLVKKEDLPRIDNILENMGYGSPIHKKLLYLAVKKSYMNSMDYFKKNEKFPTLHIHWHIVNVTLPTYIYSKNIKMDKLFECATRVTIAKAQTLQLAPHHLLLYLAEHALKHSFERSILLSDIDAVIKKYKGQINWPGLMEEAREFGLDRQLYYSLYFTRYFLDTDIPDDILSGLRPKKAAVFERQFLNSILNNSRNTKLCYLIYLGMIKGVINKLRFIVRTLFPPACILALTFNLNKPKITVKDYFIYMRKQFFYIKNYLMSLRPNIK